MTDGGHIFLISQLGDEGSPIRRRADEVHDGIVLPVANANGLRLERSDKVKTPGIVTNQIVRLIVDATIVVADVTGRNPNVFYELGIAHSFAKPVIILVDQVPALPFDTQGERVIQIGDNGQTISVTEALAAHALLSDYVAGVLAPSFKVENVVTSAAGAQALSRLAPDDATAAAIEELKEQMEDLRRNTWQTSGVRRQPEVPRRDVGDEWNISFMPDDWSRAPYAMASMYQSAEMTNDSNGLVVARFASDDAARQAMPTFDAFVELVRRLEPDTVAVRLIGPNGRSFLEHFVVRGHGE